MCVAIEKPGDFEIPHEKLVSACIVNPDGWGIMANDRGQIVSRTHYSGDNDPDQVARALEEYARFDNVYLHLRYRTKGKTDALSCHPFTIHSKNSNKLMLMHNGTLSGYGNEEVVDSLDFGLKLVGPLYERLLGFTDKPLEDPIFQDVITEYTGSTSKIVLMDTKGSFIVNRKSGFEFTEKDTGLVWWASNNYSFNRTHREPSKPTVYYGSNTRTGTQLTSTSQVKETTPEVAKFPERQLRPSFMDGFDGMDIYDFVDLTQQDVDNIVDFAPDKAKLLIMDLLLEIAYERS